MKRIFLVRHAKSDWSHAGLSDFERPLNERGHRDAPNMAERLARRIKHADAIISSPAMRAKTTAAIFARSFGIPDTAILLNEHIYEALVPALLDLVNQLDNRLNTIIMVGHNPGFSDFTQYLTGENVEMPTCAIAEIGFGADNWKEISRKTGRLTEFDFPKKERSIND